MFPYAIHIPKELNPFIPELRQLVAEWECRSEWASKNGYTVVSLYFPSTDVRNDFIANLNARVPMCAGLGKRLLATGRR